jgi:hypothetical protein
MIEESLGSGLDIDTCIIGDCMNLHSLKMYFYVDSPPLVFACHNVVVL